MGLIERQKFIFKMLDNEKVIDKFFSGESTFGLSTDDKEIVFKMDKEGLYTKTRSLKRKTKNSAEGILDKA